MSVRASLLAALSIVAGLLAATPATAADGTHVGGIVSTDTTWVAANGPYYVDSAIQIASGATLRIEAGATVISTRGSSWSSAPLFGVAGTLDVAGTDADPVVFQGGGDPGLATGLQNNTSALVRIQHADISDFDALVPATGYSQHADFDITDSVIRDITGFSYFWYPHSYARLERNLFVDVAALTFGTDSSAVATVQDNRFRGSNGTTTYRHALESWAAYGQPMQVHGNTFETSPSQTYAIRVKTAGRVDAAANYWGTQDVSAVKARIHDQEDDLNLPSVVTVEPLLSAPSVDTPAAPPGEPTGVTATRGDGSVTVGWVPPVVDGGAPVTSYDVTASPGGAQLRVGADQTSAIITGLTNGTSYAFSVAAVNSAGPSPVATSRSVVPAGVPSAPASVHAIRGDANAQVSWATSEPNGAPVTGYDITASPGGATLTVSGATSSAKITGLTNGQGYTFTVTATNEVGASQSSPPSATVVPAGVPSSPSDVSAVAGDHNAEIVWSEPGDSHGSPVTHYTVTASPGGLTTTVPADARTAILTGLSNGTTYTFRVTATNAIGDSAPSLGSSAVVPAGLPGRVSRPDIRVKRNTATVSWHAVYANGSAITAYVIRSSTGKAKRVADDVRQVTFKRLPKGVHSFTVAAVNAIGTGRASRAAKVTIR